MSNSKTKVFPIFIKSKNIVNINYLNGGKYYGQVNQKGIPDGFGLMIWNDFTCYIGQFNNNQMNGYGIVFYSNGFVHAGAFENSKFKGYAMSIDNKCSLFAEYNHMDVTNEIAKCSIIHINVASEILEFKELNDNYNKFIGETKNNSYHGLGILDNDDYTYIGQFSYNLPHGIGIKIVKNKSIYIGEFQDDWYYGYGLYIKSNNIINFGKWENNCLIWN